MKDREFKKLFKEEYQKTYNHNLTLNDIFQNGELKPKKRFDINKYWKYSSICSTCLLIICLVIIGMMVFKENNLYAHTFQTITFTENNNILTEEEFYEFNLICDGGFKKKSAQYLKIDEEVTLYVYKGIIYKVINNKLEQMYSYFYVIDFNDSNRNILINVDNQEIVVNQDNRYGILDSINVNEKQEILFTLTYYGQSRKCLYNGE